MLSIRLISYFLTKHAVGRQGKRHLNWVDFSDWVKQVTRLQFQYFNLRSRNHDVSSGSPTCEITLFFNCPNENECSLDRTTNAPKNGWDLTILEPIARFIISLISSPNYWIESPVPQVRSCLACWFQFPGHASLVRRQGGKREPVSLWKPQS